MEIHPLLLGHRGARAEKSIPENTLASFDLALSSGCDGFEFDVRLSSDRQAVVAHDATARPRGLEIAKYPVPDLGLPLLCDVLTRYQRSAFLDIELKVAGIERITADLLRSFVPARGFVVSSFLPEVVEGLHRSEPAIPLGVICENQGQLSLWRDLPVQYVILHYKLVTEQLVSEVKSAGRKILVWTVNAPAEMKRFSRWKVDGIISDHPKLLARTVGRRIQAKEKKKSKN